jgi:hypothetical protein
MSDFNLGMVYGICITTLGIGLLGLVCFLYALGIFGGP